MNIPNSLNDLINCWNRYYYVISSNINEIHQGIHNRKGNFVCLFICLYCFLSILIGSVIICSNRFFNFIKANYFIIPQFKEMIILGITGLILTFAIRIDLIIEERKFKLRNLEFFYYLIHNLKSKHKLTDKNYKRIFILARTMELFIVKLNVVISIAGITFCNFLLCLLYKTYFPVIISPLLLILLVIVQTTFHSCTALIFITIFYYKSLFDQINQRINFMFQLNFISSIEFNKIFYEHNLIAIEIDKLNEFIRRSTAVYLIVSSSLKIMFLCLAINCGN